MSKILLFFLCAFFLLASGSVFASPFSDTPSEHWAYDAVQVLAEKGLVEGYPDGFFKGDRPITRYEMAMVVARVVAKLEQIQASIPQMPDMSVYATKEDLESINKLISEYKNELNALGLRVNNVEESLGKLSSRVQELERVKISGTFSSTAISEGFSPGEKNTGSYGTPVVYSSGNQNGPSVVPHVDRYRTPYSNGALYEGFALVSKLELTVTAKVAENIKAGGDFVAYSAFGEKGVIASWGFVPSYNPNGFDYKNMHFQADLATLWFDTDGDWDFTGKYGDFNLKKVSSNLFAGLRSTIGQGGIDVFPMNGIHLSGNLYKKVDVEFFLARNLNALRNDEGEYYYGDNAFNFNALQLATPFNDGNGAVRLPTSGKAGVLPLNYGKVSTGQYDNYLQGFWAGYDFLEKKAHIEGAYLRLYEDYASNPSFTGTGTLPPPKATNYYGFKGSYSWPEDKIKIYGEFNRTGFDYNLLDNTRDTFSGNFFNIGARFKMDDLSFYGEYIRVDANYDPFGYHRHWNRINSDGHHNGWDWKFGSFRGGSVRWGNYRPNRTGFDLGLDFNFGEKGQGTLYSDFTYLNQVNPTCITNDENSFQRYNFMTGNIDTNSALTGIGANIYGNQDYMFTINDPNKGSEYNVQVGGKYSFDKLHIWGSLEYYKFSRNYADTVRSAMDLSYTFATVGATYYVTPKLGIQGSLEYIKSTGVDGRVGTTGGNVDWSQIVPGAGLKYDFNDKCDFLVDYRLYSFASDIANGYDINGALLSNLPNGNDYKSNKLITRLRIKF